MRREAPIYAGPEPKIKTPTSLESLPSSSSSAEETKISESEEESKISESEEESKTTESGEESSSSASSDVSHSDYEIECSSGIEEDERVEAYVHWVQKDSIAQMLWENVPGALVQPQRDGPLTRIALDVARKAELQERFLALYNGYQIGQDGHLNDQAPVWKRPTFQDYVDELHEPPTEERVALGDAWTKFDSFKNSGREYFGKNLMKEIEATAPGFDAALGRLLRLLQVGTVR